MFLLLNDHDFPSFPGAQLKEFCPYGVKDECLKFSQQTGTVCNKLHFKKIIQKHTDGELL